MSLKRLGSLLLRAADPANVHESEQAARLADDLATKLENVRYHVRANVEVGVVPETGGKKLAAHALKSDTVLREADRVRSTAAIAKGLLTFRTRLRGSKKTVITFIPIRDITVF